MKISLQIAHHDLASNFPRPLFKILDWPNNRDTKKIESFSLSTYGAAPVAQANRRRYAHVSKGDSIGRTLSIRNWSLIDHDVYRLCNASRTRLVVEGGMGETRIVLRGKPGDATNGGGSGTCVSWSEKDRLRDVSINTRRRL